MIADPPVITFRGEKVGIGPASKDVLPYIQRWWNDPKVMLPLSAFMAPSTERDVNAWFEKYGEKGDGSTVNFVSYELVSMQPIGMLFLFQINPRNQTAWAGGYIGETAYWGTGYAEEGAQLLLKYAFDVLGLHNVTAAIFADNKSSLRVAKVAGFQEIGRQREGVRRGDQYEDVVFLDILASDYREANR